MDKSWRNQRSRDWRNFSEIDTKELVRTRNISRSQKRDSQVDAKMSSEFRKKIQMDKSITFLEYK